MKNNPLTPLHLTPQELLTHSAPMIALYRLADSMSRHPKIDKVKAM
jgi:hypothetical protein